MIKAIVFAIILVLPFALNWLFRKRIGRYLSYILAIAVSAALVSAGLHLRPVDLPRQEEGLAILDLYIFYFSLLCWGLIWLWINAFKFRERPPITRLPVAPARDGRIEPVFATNGTSSTQMQTSAIDAIYDDPPLDEVKPNFFVRYWRGEFSLPFSFWVVGILAALVTFLVVVALRLSLDTGEYNPRTSFGLFVSVWALAFVLTIWDVVGLWRSATRYMHRRWREGRGTFWGGLVKLLLVGSVLGSFTTFTRNDAPQMGELFDMAFRGDPDIPDYSLRIMRNGTEIEIVGGFKYGLINDFRRLLKASPQIAVVHLDSVGGRIGEAMQVHDIIQERGLVTYVVNECLSACTLAFAGGRERWLGSTGKLGFHGPAFAGMPQGELNSAIASQQQLLIRDGFDPYFVARALSTPADSLWTPTTQELFAGNAVTDLAPPARFAISGFGADLDLDKAAANVKIMSPAIAAIEEHDPAAAQSIYRQFLDMYLAGNTVADVVAVLQGALDTQFRKYRSHADDETTLAFAQLAIEQIEQIARLDTKVCYEHLDGTGGANINDYLTPELIKREAELVAAMIRTAAPRKPVDNAVVDAGMKNVMITLESGPQRKNMVLYSRAPTPKEYGDACALIAATYRAALKQPRATAAALVRRLMFDDAQQEDSALTAAPR